MIGMNILVVNPANKPFTNKSILAEPIDVLNIATIIEKEFGKVKILDMDVVDMHNDINKYLDEDNIVVFVFDYQLPLHTTMAIENIFETVKKAKKKTKFIIIGKTSTHYYEKFIKNGFDVVVEGIADNTIIDVIRNIYDEETLLKIPNIYLKGDEKIIVTEKKKIINNYVDMPIPNRHLVDLSKYMDTRTMVTSRGCIGKCRFCTTPSFFGNWSGKSADKIVDEIEYLIREFNTKKIMFLDDNMTVSKKRIFDLCREIEKRHIKCLFGCLSSIKCYDKEMFEKMYEVGFRWVHFGVESGSERILKAMDKEMDIDYIKQVIKEVKEMGYRVRTSIILDYPTSTGEDVLKTEELLLDLEPNEIRLHYLAYRFGTPVYEENKNVSNKSQYIHSNRPNIANPELVERIDHLLNSLKDKGYYLILDDVDWKKYNDLPKKTKFVSFVPIKYGMCWYE